jgi:hypothetical protein
MNKRAERCVMLDARIAIDDAMAANSCAGIHHGARKYD